MLPRDAIPTRGRVESTDKWPGWCRVPPFPTEKKTPTIRVFLRVFPEVDMLNIFVKPRDSGVN
jgi:hypothetical protein